MTFTSVVAVGTVSLFPSLFFSGSLILSPQRHQHQLGNDCFSAVWPTPMKFLQPTWSCAPMCVCVCVCVCVCKSFSHVWLFVTPWTVAHQTPLSMGFSRQEFWSGLSFPSPGDLPDLGIQPISPAFPADSLLSEPPGKPCAPVTSKFSLCSSSFRMWGTSWNYHALILFLDFFKFLNNP